TRYIVGVEGHMVAFTRGDKRERARTPISPPGSRGTEDESWSRLLCRSGVGPIGDRRASAYAIADQLISSGSNFALGVVVGRLGGASALGEFGIAFLVWLALLGANRALICEPMTVSGSTTETSNPAAGVRASLTLAIGAASLLALASVVVILVGFKPAFAVLALSPWLPSLLVQ